MSIRSPWIVAVALGATIVPGCTGLFTKRAIERFAASMQESDLEGLKLSSSEHFGQKALRQDDSAKGLKMLKLPVGKVEIVAVEDLPDGKRKAKVKIGEKDKAKEMEYMLSRGPKGRGWVIDDIIMTQDSGNGHVVERTVTEQMDLLLTCREMLISWRGKVAEEKLAFCDEKLQTTLKPVPAPWLDQMFREIAGPGNQSTFKPDARLNGNMAFLVLPHPEGNLLLTMSREEDRWLLHDLALEPKSKDSTGIRSLAKMVAAFDKSAVFLSAYEAENREALQGSASAHLFKQCLSGGDLKHVPVPSSTLLNASYEARQFTDGTEAVKRVEMLLKDGEQTYMLTLREEDIPQEEAGKKVTEFRVDEVTIFEKGSKDVKKMSSLYLTHAISNAYVAALVNRDVVRLREISSRNFNDRVWGRAESSYFAIMPDPQLEAGEPEIISTIFRGDVSEVTLIQGETPMTLVLNLANGWMVVDDVLLPAIDRPSSLKANLELMLSVHAFASALHQKDTSKLLRYSADGLDRIVWRQLSDVPDLCQQLVRPMLSEVVSVEPGENINIVRTSEGDVQAEIKLVREGDMIVVHDVMLTSKSDPNQQLVLLATLRQMIAAGQLGPANKKTGQIMPVAGVQPVAPSDKYVNFEPIEIAPNAETPPKVE